MGLSRPKDGNPSTRFYENPEIIATFDPVRTWLTRNHKKYTQSEPPTNKSLATLCFQLLQFQESTLLRSPKSFVKLPSKCFMDFKPGGGLCHIFLACLKFRHEHNWKKIDLSSSSRLEKHLEMLNCVERDLIASKCWEKPAVFISPSIEKTLVSRLMESAGRMGSTVVENPIDATHVIHPPPANWPGNNSEDSQHHRFRVIFQEGRGVLLHWLYSPGTYTTWYTGLQMEWPYGVESPPHPESGRPWDVDARWLLYSEENNEWMVEEDFLIPAGGLRPRASYTPDEFLATAAAVACTASNSGSHSTSMQYSDSLSNPSGFSSDVPNSTKKKRRRSPSPVSETASIVIGGTKKRRPGSSGERSSRLTGNHASSRKIRKEDEDEASCQTVQSDTIQEENDLTREFDDPEPLHRVTHVPATMHNGPPVPSSSRPSRSSTTNAQTGEGSGGRSILFDLDEENDGGEVNDALLGVSDSHAHPSAGTV